LLFGESNFVYDIDIGVTYILYILYNCVEYW